MCAGRLNRRLGGITHHGVRASRALVGRETDIVDDEAGDREVCNREKSQSLVHWRQQGFGRERRVRAGPPWLKRDSAPRYRAAPHPYQIAPRGEKRDSPDMVRGRKQMKKAEEEGERGGVMGDCKEGGRRLAL